MNEITQRLTTAIAGRYKIESHLGQGGMAIVYLAEDIKHDRRVALKVLRPELAAVIGAERFLNEIKVTANLQHPHILPLHDSGEADSFLYYVMPFVEGDTLRDKINREKQLGIDDAIDISRSVASALDYAHRQGVIHRDIKPENILLHDGQALVADFGIALAISAAGGNRLTETGLSIGTPHYMSPEQAMGDRELDARSDVYSLGAMLYEMLTGDPPYQGSTAQAIVAKVITEKAPLVTATRDTVPGHVAAAVQKALAKLPADRFSSAAEFADALTRPGAIPFTTHFGVGGDATAPRSRRTAAMAVGAAVLTAAVGLVIGRVSAPDAGRRLTQFVVPAPDSVVTFGRCCGAAMALSPDGNTLVFVGNAGGGRGPLYRREAGRLDAEPIPGTEGAAVPFFSPDGRWVGFHIDSRLRKVSMAGGPPVTIADVGGLIRGANWGDNDVILYSANEDRDLYAVPGAGGEPRHMAGGETVQYLYPFVLPGGEAALFSLRSGAVEETRLGVVDLQTGRVDTIGVGTRATYSSSGHLVFTGADGSLLAQPFDPKGRRTTGQAVAILDGVLVRGDGNGEFAISREGSLAYSPGGAAGDAEDLVFVGADARTPVRPPQGSNFEDVAISPDGRRIALRLSDVSQGNDIWVFDRNQGTLVRLTVDGENQFPLWSRDGARIAFRSQRNGTDAIYWKRADGSGTAEMLYHGSGPAFPMSFHPDGRLLLVEQRGDDRLGDIGLLAPGDSAVRWLVESPFWDRQAQLAPDGRWIAYTSDRSGDPEVYLEALSGEGGRFQVSISGGHSPRWSTDGATLYYGFQPQIVAASMSFGREIAVTDRKTVVEGAIDFNFQNSNYDVDPRTGQLLVVLQGTRRLTSLVWIQNWPEIVRAMETGR